MSRTVTLRLDVSVMLGILLIFALGHMIQQGNVAAADKYFNENPHRVEFKSAVLQREVMVGMNKEEVRLAWGKPHVTTTTDGMAGLKEHWIWRSVRGDRYVEFKDGYVISWAK